MTAYVGHPVTVTALPSNAVTGNPVRVSAPRAFYARFDGEGNLQPARLGIVTEAGVEWLTPPI